MEENSMPIPLIHLDGINNKGENDQKDKTLNYWVNLADNSNIEIKGKYRWTEKGLYFNGQDTWLNCNSQNPTNITIEALFKFRNVIGNDRDDYSIIGNHRSKGFGLTVVQNKINFKAYIGSAYKNISTPDDIEENKLYHIVVTYDGKTIKMFLNGELCNSVAASGKIVHSTSPLPILGIGCRPAETGDCSSYMNGYIYNIKLYNTALDDGYAAASYSELKEKYIGDNEEHEEEKNFPLFHFDGANNTGNGEHNKNLNYWTNLIDNSNIEIKGSYQWNNIGLKFNGRDTWLNCGRYNFRKKITFEALFEFRNILGATTDKSSIVGNWQEGGYGINITDGKVCFSVYIDGSRQYLYTKEAAQSNTIYHIVGTYDGKILKMYHNGELCDSKEIGGYITLPKENTVMAIGADPKGSDFQSSPMDGYIYNVKMYDTALDEEYAAESYSILREKYLKPKEKEFILGYTADGLTSFYDGMYNKALPVEEAILQKEGEETPVEPEDPTHDKNPSLWKDLVGNNDGVLMYGTVVNNNNWNEENWNEKSCVLNGNNYIRIFKENKLSFTYEILFKTTQNDQSKGDFFYQGAGLINCEVPNKCDCGMSIDGNGKILSGIGERTSNTEYTLTSKYYNLNNGEYHTATFVRDRENQEIRLYIDGEKSNWKSTHTKPIIGNDYLYIGSVTTETGRLKGEISSVRIYERALTEEEIVSNFNIDKQRFSFDTDNKYKFFKVESFDHTPFFDIKDWRIGNKGGREALQSKEITHNQTTELSFEIIAKEFEMDWIVSSESSYDWMTIFVDGIQKEKTSGNDKKGTVSCKWKKQSGHTILLRYNKDSSNNSGDDCFYITEIRYYQYIEKFLFKDGEDIKTLVDGKLTSIGKYPPTKEEFMLRGLNMADANIILSNRNNFTENEIKVLFYTDNPDRPSCKLSNTGTPYGELVYRNSDVNFKQSYIIGLSRCSIKAEVGENSTLKFVFSVDSGETWLTWEDNTWKEISFTKEAVGIHGMDLDVVNSLSPEALAEISKNKKIRFGWYARKANFEENVKVIQIKFEYSTTL